MTPYDQWKLDTPDWCEPLSEAEEAAAAINDAIAGTALEWMGCSTVADGGAVNLCIGEHCVSELEPSVALSSWRAELAAAFIVAIEESRKEPTDAN